MHALERMCSQAIIGLLLTSFDSGLGRNVVSTAGFWCKVVCMRHQITQRASDEDGTVSTWAHLQDKGVAAIQVGVSIG